MIVLLAFVYLLAYPRAYAPSTQGLVPMSHESPFNAIPPVVIVLAGMVCVIELVFGMAEAGVVGGPGGIGWRVAAFQNYGFAPSFWDVIVGQGQWSFEYLKRFVTYAFVQPAFTSALFGAGMLLALGKFVGDLYHWAAVVAIVLVSCVTGAVAFGVLAPGNPPLLGVFPVVYGLIGAFTYVSWLRLGQMGRNQLQAFQLIGFLMAFQLVFGLLFGAGWTWIAELAGFVAGLFVAPFVAPGGWAAFLRRMRNR